MSEEDAIRQLEDATDELVTYLHNYPGVDVGDLPPEGQRLYKRWQWAKKQHQDYVLEQLNLAEPLERSPAYSCALMLVIVLTSALIVALVVRLLGY